jgi:hypothetical protein
MIWHPDVMHTIILSGKLDSDEIEHLNLYRDLHQNCPQIQNIPVQKLIYPASLESFEDVLK